MARIGKYLAGCLIVFLGCQQKQTPEEGINTEDEQVQILRKEVMEVHNQAMNKIESIMALKTQLKEKVTSLKEDTTKVNEVIVHDMLIQSLDASQTSMREWMQRYNAHQVSKDPQIEMTFLDLEKKRILGVEAQMNMAIKAAEAALKTD